jgi:type II secretory pathway component GspD/PulD (secretin)
MQQQQPGAPGQAQATEETGLRIVDISDLNALFVQYENTAQLKDVTHWIKTLDIPKYQVSMELKFVEVIEDRARELSSEINVADLTDLSDFGSNNRIGARFGKDIDEYRSPFEPGVETIGTGGARGANLNKGTTALDWVTGARSPVSIQLRALESQGVINVVNGPHVTCFHEDTASFLIERQFGVPTPIQGATTGGGTNQFQAVPSLTQVDIDLTPFVFSLGNIEIELTATIMDFDTNLASFALLTPPGGQTLVSGQPGERWASLSDNFNIGVLRKELETKVRIKDGGTVVLGGWTSQRDQKINSGVPLLQDLPFVGKLLFARNLNTSNKITLLIFLTGNIVD